MPNEVMEKLKGYPTYKESGLENTGTIPEDWSMMKLKYLTHQIIDGTHYTPEYQDNGIPFLRVTDIHTKEIDLSKVKYITLELHQELTRRCKPEKGNLLLSKNGTIGVTRVIDWDFDFSIFVSLCLIKFKADIFSPQFFSYLFQSQVIDQQLRESSKTTTVTNLHLDKISELFVVKPSLPEQHAIANFLDRKTQHIDDLIRVKERKIELLQEYRASLIHQAVTKGLDPNAEMKSSAMAWIGKNPCHWQTIKIKYLTENLDGKRIPLSGEVRSGQKRTYPYYGANGVIDYVEDYIFEGDYILIGEDGAPFFDKKKDVSFLASGKFWVNNHCHVLRNIGTNETRFVVYCLNAADYTEYITGSTRDKLTQADLDRIEIPMPSCLEQNQIANFLDHKTKQIDELRSTEEQSIKLLKEYRQSLISAVVTGKIDVRNEV